MPRKKSPSKSKRVFTRRYYRLKLKKGTSQLIAGIVVITISVLLAASFTRTPGILATTHSFLTKFFGATAIFIPFMALLIGLILIGLRNMLTRPHVLLGSILLLASISGFTGSGIVGEEIYLTLSNLISSAGATILLIASVLTSITVLFNFSITQVQLFITTILVKLRLILEKIIFTQDDVLPASTSPATRRLSFTKDGKLESQTDGTLKIIGSTGPETPPLSSNPPVTTSSPIPIPTKPTLSNNPNPSQPWKLPPLSLLSNTTEGQAQRGDVKKNAQIIENTLESFGLDARVVEVNLGPSVTQYAIEVAIGTKLSKILNLTSDLALALAAPTGQIRIEAPIPGRSLVGIELPNHSQELVSLKQMLGSATLKSNESKTTVALGRDVSGEPKVLDLIKMPHLLVAGATGSGKSACINSIIASILFRAKPTEVKFILVDPKRVELTQYNGIPHLLTPVIVDVDKVPSALNWCLATMTERYKEFAQVGARNIESYNKMKGYQAVPYIIVIIDELADIMMSAPRVVEESIARLAQMARATGIHLVIATQRPSVDVITGLIKANIPARIAFAVSSGTDSKVIIDTPGAEKLLGRGDMLFIPPDQAKPIRIQGTFVQDAEINKLLAFIKNQGLTPDYTEDITSMSVPGTSSSGNGSATDDKDPEFIEAVRVIVQENKASASLLQRKLSIGYARAARIMDQLEESGVIGPSAGSKPRDIRIDMVNRYIGGATSPAVG